MFISTNEMIDMALADEKNAASTAPIRENQTTDIETAMKLHGLELDNGRNPDNIFMRWTSGGWLVYEIGDYVDATIYQGGDLGQALAALVGVSE